MPANKPNAWPLLAVSLIATAAIFVGQKLLYKDVLDNLADTQYSSIAEHNEALIKDPQLIQTLAGQCGLSCLQHNSYATQTAVANHFCGPCAACPGPISRKVPFLDLPKAHWGSEQLLDLLNSCNAACPQNTASPQLVLRVYLHWTPRKAPKRGLFGHRRAPQAPPTHPEALFHAFTVVQHPTGGQWQLYQSFSYSLETHLTSRETGVTPLSHGQLQKLIQQLQVLERHRKQWDVSADEAFSSLTGISLLQSHDGQTDGHRARLLRMLGVQQDIAPSGGTTGEGKVGKSAANELADALVDAVLEAASGVDNTCDSDIAAGAGADKGTVQQTDSAIGAVDGSSKGQGLGEIDSEWQLPLQLRWDVACVAGARGARGAPAGAAAARVRIVQGISDAELRMWLHKWLVHHRDSYDPEQ